LEQPQAEAHGPEQGTPATDEEPQIGHSAPDYWKAEDKVLWNDVPDQLRPVLHRYESERMAFLHEKNREAARARDEAVRAAKAAASVVEQAAVWWQQNGPAFSAAFDKKWAEVDWKGLAEKDPQEVARLITQRQEEEALLAETRRRGEADMAATNERAEQELLAARRAEHAKLESSLPEFFGPERARQTYDELSRFLFAKGIPADRISSIYEAPVIELALSAMRFEKAKQALRSREGSERQIRPTTNPAKTTPSRIGPGPAARLDNRAGDAVRQVGERFRQSGGASIADAAELIRLNNL
jgi:hypothetical protein